MSQTATVRYAGVFRHAFDAKNRLTIPARWRFAGDEEEGAYLAMANSTGCITMYPPHMVATIEGGVGGVGSLSNVKEMLTLQQIFAQCDLCACDKQGRIGLSDRLRERAGLGREAVLLGTLKVFHIWSPERFAVSVEAPGLSPTFDPTALQKFNV